MDSNETDILSVGLPKKLATSNFSENESDSRSNSDPAVSDNNRGVHNPAGNKEACTERDSEKLIDNGSAVPMKSSPSNDPVDFRNSCILQNEQQSQQDSSVNVEVPHFCNSTDSSGHHSKNGHSFTNEKVTEVVVKTSKPLCADYQSDTDSESVDSESDSSTSDGTSPDASSSSEYESDDSNNSSTVPSKTVKGEKKLKGDLSLADLPPIETLIINVAEDSCVEIGTIRSIVETLVIVESYKGTSALDVDTILFLDCGKRTLGKVFDILGPVSEPVYAVRFNSHEQIKSLDIKKDMKVYYAPKTEHTTFVFMSEVLKHKGSDASWKDNVEAPPEFQDFSDDEEERQHKNKQGREIDRENPNQNEQHKSRKRPFNKGKPTPGVLQGSRFRSTDFSQQRPYFQRNVLANHFVAPPPFPRPNFPNPVQIPPFPYTAPPYPATNSLSRPLHPFMHRFSGPPFPAFGGIPIVTQSQNFQQPFYQQRTHAFPQPFGGWGRPVLRPPPPPPPPADTTDSQPSSECVIEKQTKSNYEYSDSEARQTTIGRISQRGRRRKQGNLGPTPFGFFIF